MLIFQTLYRQVSEMGLEKLIYTTQAQFLVDWGILDIYEKHLKNDDKRYPCNKKPVSSRNDG